MEHHVFIVIDKMTWPVRKLLARLDTLVLSFITLFIPVSFTDTHFQNVNIKSHKNRHTSSNLTSPWLGAIRHNILDNIIIGSFSGFRSYLDDLRA